MSIQPHGENLRNAVKWIGAERKANPDQSVQKLLDHACLAFNLTPAEAAYLESLMKGGQDEGN